LSKIGHSIFVRQLLEVLCIVFQTKEHCHWLSGIITWYVKLNLIHGHEKIKTSHSVSLILAVFSLIFYIWLPDHSVCFKAWYIELNHSSTMVAIFTIWCNVKKISHFAMQCLCVTYNSSNERKSLS